MNVLKWHQLLVRALLSGEVSVCVLSSVQFYHAYGYRRV